MADDGHVTDDGHGNDDYELLDCGDGARLERFGPLVVDRPAPGALAPRRDPSAWPAADLRFEPGRGWSGPGLLDADDGWATRVQGMDVGLRPTAAGQVGLFPEHAALLSWLRDRIEHRLVSDRPVQVLHLFAYTGLATMAMARAGAAVAHVDSSRPTVAWARANAALNDLSGAPIRWLIDDARTFTAREVRRGRQYDGVVLDPPTYGHGDDRQTWSLERDLASLMADVERLLLPDGFVLLSAHTEGFDEDRLASHVRRRPSDATEAGELSIDAASGARLRLGAFARRDGRP